MTIIVLMNKGYNKCNYAVATYHCHFLISLLLFYSSVLFYNYYYYSINFINLLSHISAGYAILQNTDLLSITLKEILTYRQICAQLKS